MLDVYNMGRVLRYGRLIEGWRGALAPRAARPKGMGHRFIDNPTSGVHIPRHRLGGHKKHFGKG